MVVGVPGQAVTAVQQEVGVVVGPVGGDVCCTTLHAGCLWRLG